MKKILFFGLPLSFLVYSCSKELGPVTGNDTPVFNVLFTSGSVKNTVSAGLENIYLFTDYQIDSNWVNLTGTFSNAGCKESICPQSLKFTLRLDKNNFQPQDLDYPYLRNIDPSFTYKTLTVTPTDTSNRDFSIKMLGQESNNSPLSVNIFDAEPVELKIDATDRVNQVVSAVKVRYLPGYPDSCHAVRLLAKVENGAATFRAEINGLNLNYNWSNGAHDTNLVVIADIGIPNNNFEVTVTSPDGGCQSITSLSNLPEDTGNEWISSTGADIQLSGFVNGLEQTGIRIDWTDNSGVQFSSVDVIQSNNSYFKISNIEPYELNEQGQQTIKLTIDFKCVLVAQNTPSLEPLDFSGSGVIGIAVPRL